MANMDLVEIVARLTLKDVRVFTSDAARARYAVDQLGESGRNLRSSLGGATSAVVTNLSHDIVMAGTAIGVAAAATGAFGIKAAGDLEQVGVAFDTMLGSADASKRMIVDLQHFAATTPFNFVDLVQDSRRLLAYGFGQDGIIPMLTSMGNAAAGLGLGEDGIKRMTLALGQMQAKARVQSQELLQLTESGIPAIKILADGLGLSEQHLLRVVEQGRVSSEVAIPMLLAGMDQRFGGLMDKQSKTLFGLFSNFKDYATQALAGLATPFLPFMERGLTELNAHLPGLRDKYVSRINTIFAQGHQQFAGMTVRQSVDMMIADPSTFGSKLDSTFNSGTRFRDLLSTWMPVLHDVYDTFHDSVIPVIQDLLGILKPVVIDALHLVADAFDFMANHSSTTQTLLWGLIIGYTALSVVLGVAAAAMTVANTIITINAARLALASLWSVISMSTFGTFAGVLWLNVAAWIATAAAEAAALWPIYLIVAAIGLLVFGLVMAYRHVGWFHDSVDAMVHFITKTDWLGVFKAIVNAVSWAVNLMIKAWNMLDFSINIGGIPGTGFHGFHSGDIIPDIPEIPMLAKGGTSVASGTVLVGEKGPELLNLPGGASVVPLSDSVRDRVLGSNNSQQSGVPLVVQLVMDRRVLVEQVLTEVRAINARA